MNNKEQILAYCKLHGSITVRDAAVDLEMNSARKTISEMRHSPRYEVEDIFEERTNRFGQTKRYKRYFIREVESAL